MSGRRRIRCGATGGITPCDEQSPALKGRSRALSDRAAVTSRNVPPSVSDAHKLKSLEDENRRLKKLLAESMLDASTLKEMLGKNF